MPRLIFLLLVFLALYYITKRLIGRSHRGGSPQKQAQSLVQCTHCGLHIPLNEGRLIHGQYYCNNPACQAESNAS